MLHYTESVTAPAAEWVLVSNGHFILRLCGKLWALSVTQRMSHEKKKLHFALDLPLVKKKKKKN